MFPYNSLTAPNNEYFVLLCQEPVSKIKTGENLLFELNGYLIHTLLFSCLFPVGRIPPYLSILWQMWYIARGIIWGIQLLSICAGSKGREPRMKSLMGRIIIWGISWPDDVLIIFQSVPDILDNALLRLRHGISFSNKNEPAWNFTKSKYFIFIYM